MKVFMAGRKGFVRIEGLKNKCIKPLKGRKSS